MSEYIEIVCMSTADVMGEMSRKASEDFEFVSVIFNRPGTFLLRMRRKTSSNPNGPV